MHCKPTVRTITIILILGSQLSFVNFLYSIDILSVSRIHIFNRNPGLTFKRCLVSDENKLLQVFSCTHLEPISRYYGYGSVLHFPIPGFFRKFTLLASLEVTDISGLRTFSCQKQGGGGGEELRGVHGPGSGMK